MQLRGPFEPPRRGDAATASGPGSRAASRAPQPGNGMAGGLQAVTSGGQPGSEGMSAVLSSALEQIKDLYLTAEAIGEDALGKHFELVSDRQRKLIREYFDKAVAGQPEGQGPEDRPS
jgi:hypothetical protein